MGQLDICAKLNICIKHLALYKESW